MSNISPFLFRHGYRRATFPPGEGVCARRAQSPHRGGTFTKINYNLSYLQILQIGQGQIVLQIIQCQIGVDFPIDFGNGFFMPDF